MLALPPSSFPQAPRGGEQVGGPCKRRISPSPSPERRGCPETRSWDAVGHAGVVGVRRRLGSAGLSSARGSPGTHRQQMEGSYVIPAGVGVGREGHGRRTKAGIYCSRPFTGSPSLPPRAGLFLHFLCFSCLLGHPDADTHTKSEPSGEAVPLPPAPRAPLRPRSTVVPLNRAGREPEPLPRGQAGPGASGAPPASSSAETGETGFSGEGPERSGLVGFAHASIAPALNRGNAS